MGGRLSHMVGLASLPPELGDHISSFLTNRDIKSLRLTFSFVCRIVTLRIDRVFISANPRNIEVVHEIAKHEEFRKRVREVIWDETYFDWPDTHIPFLQIIWYKELCKPEIDRLGRSEGNDCVIDRPGHAVRMRQLGAAMPPEESFKFYQKLLQEQDRVLRSRVDVKAFEYALDRFPSLRQVTISTKTHGRLFMPLYESPMIRSFLYGFMYPLPQPELNEEYYAYKPPWRHQDPRPVHRHGVCSTLRALAKHGKHDVSEFVIEDAVEYTHKISDGISTQTCTLADLHLLIQRPGFRRLDLHTSRRFPLHETLEKVENLQSLCVQVTGHDLNTEYAVLKFSNQTWTHINRHAKMDEYPEFPRPLVQNLQNLVIQGACVDIWNLVMALAPLASLRSLELRSVSFNHEKSFGEALECAYISQNPSDFLYALRDNTDWRSRPLRPKVTIFLSDERWAKGQMVKIDSEVNEFLYEDGENPFVCVTEFKEIDDMWVRLEHGDLDKMCSGKGINMDELDPEYERPNYDDETLKLLGIISTDENSGYERWGMGPWGPQTCPTLQEQGIKPYYRGLLSRLNEHLGYWAPGKLASEI
ncbi:cyclinlike f-box [Fusarium sporotrichioides]|uniref:Cyclinlike f-box n=1 Tax=Fusarium sporotrichioides TaxID=5514 RepID=A0A395RMH9_FUSSP|nr:cyclinlike f-box [Fusarium sporotrichioides]